MTKLLRLCLFGIVPLAGLGVSVSIMHAQASASSQLGATMKLLQDKMNAQGPFQYLLYEVQRNGTRQPGMLQNMSQSSFVADAAACRINFQIEKSFEYANPNPLTPPPPPMTTSGRLFLKVLMPEYISVIDAAESWRLIARQTDPEGQFQTDPQVFIVHVRLDQSSYREIYFHEKADADIVAKALQLAIQLCNPSASKDPF